MCLSYVSPHTTPFSTCHPLIPSVARPPLHHTITTYTTPFEPHPRIARAQARGLHPLDLPPDVWMPDYTLDVGRTLRAANSASSSPCSSPPPHAASMLESRQSLQSPPPLASLAQTANYACTRRVCGASTCCHAPPDVMRPNFPISPSPQSSVLGAGAPHQYSSAHGGCSKKKETG